MRFPASRLAAFLLLFPAVPLMAQQEVVLQYFNTSWNEITSPQDGTAAAMPRATITSAPGSVKLFFPVLKSRRYQVQRSSDLTTWPNAGTEITPAADNAACEWTDPAPPPGRIFYHLSARLP